MTITAIEPMAPELLALGSDPDLLRLELVGLIKAGMDANPRSAQLAIGPSELGTPCERRLGHRLAGTPRVQSNSAWRPTVGTAVHSWLEYALEVENIRLGNAGQEPRWLLEHRVDVGEVNGVTITGKSDVYDRVTATIIDWKIVGAATLKRAGTGKIDDSYRAQQHLYGRGYIRAGLPVERVAVFYLPSAGELSQAKWWTEPFDESIAVAALNRASGVAALVNMLGAEKVIPNLPTAEAYCTHCPWYMPAASDLTEACPGHREEVAA